MARPCRCSWPIGVPSETHVLTQDVACPWGNLVRCRQQLNARADTVIWNGAICGRGVFLGDHLRPHPKGSVPQRPPYFLDHLYAYEHIARETAAKFGKVIKLDGRKFLHGRPQPIPWPNFLWHECCRAICLRRAVANLVRQAWICKFGKVLTLTGGT